MKTLLIFLAAVLGVATSVLAAERTITTRRGDVYEKAEIIKTDATNILISHADGIATISLEDLPVEMQKELGYVTLAERAKKAQAIKAVQDIAVAEAKAVEEAVEKAKEAADKAKKAKLAALPLSTSVEARTYLGKKVSDLEAEFGKPIKTEKVAPDIKCSEPRSLYVYSASPKTAFVVNDDTKNVVDGCYRGAEMIEVVKR